MYPIKLKPIFKQHPWGGQTLFDIKKGQGVRVDRSKLYGESWDVSGIDGSVSVVSNGFLKGNNLQELIEVYMGDLVGESVFERFGLEFPLLLKTLTSEGCLSVQVHPDDEVAAERHDSCGKTEMWYVVSAKPESKIYLGFKDKNITREEYIEAVAKGTVADIIRPVSVKAGDAFLLKSGTVHSISEGVSLLEVQQPVDLTYRIFDWNRVDAEGNSRELHTAQAVDVIDFGITAEDCRCSYELRPNEMVEIVKCDYFTVKILQLDGVSRQDYCSLDSFVIYSCTEGSAEIVTDGGSESIKAGEVVLIPAEMGEVTISGKATLLEYSLG
ncbi:MAG: class I mannose-6-phosphate isomerase [Alistipes sp.]|nr:class I mannose-6-phosphate isomerase [Alistipes sp.]